MIEQHSWLIRQVQLIIKIKYMKKICSLLIIIVLFSCDKKTSSMTVEDYDLADIETVSNDNLSETEGIEDGTHSADIEYYNPDTGHTANYTLDVRVRNGKLVEIEFENGGWLDESHFSAPDISDGSASFTDDEGREFNVKILK